MRFSRKGRTMDGWSRVAAVAARAPLRRGRRAGFSVSKRGKGRRSVEDAERRTARQSSHHRVDGERGVRSRGRQPGRVVSEQDAYSAGRALEEQPCDRPPEPAQLPRALFRGLRKESRATLVRSISGRRILPRIPSLPGRRSRAIRSRCRTTATGAAIMDFTIEITTRGSSSRTFRHPTISCTTDFRRRSLRSSGSPRTCATTCTTAPLRPATSGFRRVFPRSSPGTSGTTAY